MPQFFFPDILSGARAPLGLTGRRREAPFYFPDSLTNYSAFRFHPDLLAPPTPPPLPSQFSLAPCLSPARARYSTCGGGVADQARGGGGAGSDGRKRGTAVGGVWRLRRLEPLLSPRGRSSSLRAATSRRSRERGLASRGFSCSAAHAPSPEGRRRGVPGDALGAGKLDAGGRSLRLALASCPRRPLPITSSPPGSSKKEEMKLVN